MFIVIYRWKLKHGFERQFQNSWREITEEIYQNFGSLGSRLHQTDDEIWIGYAQWQCREDWEAMQNSTNEIASDASRMMKESIAESSPPMLMDVVENLLKTEKSPK